MRKNNTVKNNKKVTRKNKYKVLRELWKRKHEDTLLLTLDKITPIAPPPKKVSFRDTLWLFFGHVPVATRYWTTLFFGERGSGKTLHQAKTVTRILYYLNRLYRIHPEIPRAFIWTNQHMAKYVLSEYGENGGYGNLIYHWDDLDELHYCPRTNCWKGNKKHLLHGCYIIFDDVSVVLDPKYWDITPAWLKKYFFMGRHLGIHMLASLVDPLAVDIAFRRCVDMAFQFKKVWGNRDPDETRPALTWIFGIYRSRKVDAKTLWEEGNMPERTIRLNLVKQDEEDEQLKEAGRKDAVVKERAWLGQHHIFTVTGKIWPYGFKIFGIHIPKVASTDVYDTLENVKEREVKGLRCKEIRCIEPSHIHPWDFPEEDIKILKRNHNYCDKVKKIYEAV